MDEYEARFKQLQETGVAAFDPTDPEAVLSAILDLGARVTDLEDKGDQ